MTPIKHTGKKTGKQPDSDTPAGSPPPTVTLGETTLNNLPVLTEIVSELGINLPREFNDEEIKQLLHQLEARIEIMFTQKLGLHLEQLQRQAIDHALDELKAELPGLLQDALNAYLDTR
jgi:hypothetical protein